MTKTVSLIGSKPFANNYSWISNLINQIKPDTITLEKSIINPTGLYSEFEAPLKKLIKEHQKGYHLLGDFAAGIHYARQNNVPVYFIDIDKSFLCALININQGTNYGWIKENYLPKRQIIDTPEQKNNFIADAINYHMHNYNNIVYIGESENCNSLKKLIVADSKNILTQE